jgi:hypothetical protein
MAYQEFQTCTDAVFESRKNIDIDGTALYETEFGSLLREIITRNDTPLLKQYIAAYDLHTSGVQVTEMQSRDPFYTAVADGSLDVLRVLLDLHRRNPKSVSIEERGFSLLNVACEHAQIEVVSFLLDTDPPLGTVHDRDPGGWTPIMSAAYSTGALAAADRARGEALVSMLLDQGASARDSVRFTANMRTTGEAQPAPQPEFTVLSLAITGSSYAMVKRLIEHDADVWERLCYYSDDPGVWDDGINIWDITLLHMGSRSWNADGIRAVLDHGDDAGKGGAKDSGLI